MLQTPTKSSVCNSEGIKRLLIFFVKTFHIVILDGTESAFGNSANAHAHAHISEREKKPENHCAASQANQSKNNVQPGTSFSLAHFRHSQAREKNTLSNSGHCCSICMQSRFVGFFIEKLAICSVHIYLAFFYDCVV